jgi:uncharacterized protein YdeI (YjbR/CyaY-like superfamily)
MAEVLPELLVPTAEEWGSWLAAHHASETGVRLVVAKKGFTEPTNVTYTEAVEEALCYGWIDSVIGRRDERTYFVRFSPRSRAAVAWRCSDMARRAASTSLATIAVTMRRCWASEWAMLRSSRGMASRKRLMRMRTSATAAVSDGDPVTSAIAICRRESSRR